MKPTVFIEQIVPHLKEVGDPVLRQAEHVARKAKAVADAQAELEAARKNLEDSIAELWTAREVAQAVKSFRNTK